jgi:hypothetical protein
MTLLHGRHIGPLLTVWGAGFLIAGGLYWIQNKSPALVDLMTPLYIGIGVILLIASVKWLRERNHERRHADRRHADRRGAEQQLAEDTAP